MPIIWTRGRLAVLVATGMLLFLGGVVAGSAVGTLIRPEPTAPAGRPMLLGQENRAGEQPTRLFASTRGGALWSRQNGPGTAVRGESGQGHGAVFNTGHRNASGLRAENTADNLGSGAGVTAVGNRNPGLRASSETVGLIAAGDQVSLYAEGEVVVYGSLRLDGGCAGCFTTTLAENASAAPLTRGDAVTVIGTAPDSSGALLLQVVPAGPLDRAIGIVLTPVHRAAVPIDAHTEIDHFPATGTAAAPGGLLAVVISGIVDFAKADESGGVIRPGDPLTSGENNGTLTRALPSSGVPVIGYAVAGVVDEHVTLLISPR